MATTAPLGAPVNAVLRTRTRHRSNSREPRVRSILLSASQLSAPNVPSPREQEGADHTLRTRRPDIASVNDQQDWSSRRPDGAQIPVDQTVSDGRPPSIRLTEHVDTTFVPAPDYSENSNDGDDPNMAPRPPMSGTTTRTRRMTLDLPTSPIDVLYQSDHKLSFESTSPKPCIVPGNALHLIDDDPSAPRSATPPSVIIVGDESEHGVEVETDMDGDYEGEASGDGDGVGTGGERSASQLPHARPTPRVRFRSRVRITSGVHRHRHSASVTGASTPGSSTEDSPSSSISAPLRYQADENAPWGPIGKRLSGYAAGAGQRRPQGGQVQGARSAGGKGGVGARGGRGYHERTPLLRPPLAGSYSESEDEGSEGMAHEERAARAAALRREEEAVFGKWPWRIFNRHWWWWHVEPVLCCCCADDSDYEEF